MGDKFLKMLGTVFCKIIPLILNFRVGDSPDLCGTEAAAPEP